MSRVMFVQGAGDIGGAERVLLGVASHLPALGYTPIVGVYGCGPLAAELRAHRVQVVEDQALPRARQPWAFRRGVQRIVSDARTVGADLIQSNGEQVARYGGVGARSLGVPSVHWLHDAPLRSVGAAVVQATMAVLPHDVLVVGSEWMADAFRARLRLRTRVIPLGVDLALAPGTPAPVRAAAGWPADAAVVTFVGRLQRWKGPDVFLRAAAGVARRCPEARFAIVGGALFGWEQDFAADLPRLADRLGIADRVLFAGHRDDAWAWMAGSDVVVHCSTRAEPLGLVVLEAMAVGRPVVATTTRGPEEVVEDGHTGLLVPPGDVDRTAAAIERLLGLPDRGQAMGSAAARRVRATRSAIAMAEGFAALYQELGVP